MTYVVNTRESGCTSRWLECTQSEQAIIQNPSTFN